MGFDFPDSLRIRADGLELLIDLSIFLLQLCITCVFKLAASASSSTMNSGLPAQKLVEEKLFFHCFSTEVFFFRTIIRPTEKASERSDK